MKISWLTCYNHPDKVPVYPEGHVTMFVIILKVITIISSAEHPSSHLYIIDTFLLQDWISHNKELAFLEVVMMMVMHSAPKNFWLGVY